MNNDVINGTNGFMTSQTSSDADDDESSQYKRQVAKLSRRMYSKGWAVACMGTVSIRDGELVVCL